MKKNDDEACPRLNVVMFSNTPILFAFFCLIPLPHYNGSDSGIRYHSNREKTLISAETCEALDGTVARNVAHQPNFSIPTWRRSSSLGKKPKSRKVNITIAHLNVRSMASREKFYLVKQRIVHDNHDIFVISESWLDPSTTNNNIQIPGCVIFRQDRGPHKSGARSLFTPENNLNHRSSITCQQLRMLIPNNFGLKSSAGNQNLFYYALRTSQIQ